MPDTIKDNLPLSSPGDTGRLESTEKEGIDILLVSYDLRLFNQLKRVLQKKYPKYSARLTQDFHELQPIEVYLSKCDVILCDIRHNLSYLTNLLKFFDLMRPQAFIVGISADCAVLDNIFNEPSALRLTDIININAGWDKILYKVDQLRVTWLDPALKSRIEDVAVADVIQMINVGNWTSIVIIHGRLTELSLKTIRGCIYFYNGQPETAWSSNNVGRAAVYDLLSLTRGSLQVVISLNGHFVKNLYGTVQEMLMSYYMAKDELKKYPKEEYHTEKLGVKSDVGALRLKQLKEKIEIKPLLNNWWLNNAKYAQDVLTDIKEDSIPLRWMRESELEVLIKSPDGKQFLVFSGAAWFLSIILQCGINFNPKKFTKNLFPVLRLGLRKNYLYLIFLKEDIIIDSLKKYPWVLWTEPRKIKCSLRHLCDSGCEILITYISKNLDRNQYDSLFEDKDVIGTWLSAPEPHWKGVSQRLPRIVLTLLKMTKWYNNLNKLPNN